MKDVKLLFSPYLLAPARGSYKVLSTPIRINTDFAWHLIPVVLLLITGGIVSTLTSGNINRISYHVEQHSLFLNMNEFLGILPNTFWLNVTQLGDAAILFPILTLILFRYQKALVAILCSIPAAAIITHIGKNIAAVPRPAAVLDYNKLNVIGDILTGHNSLPSGHTITVFTGLVAASVVLLTQSKRVRQPRLIAIFMFIAGLVGLSRVAVAAHWPMDVLLGASCGWIAALSGVFLAKGVPHFSLSDYPSYSWALGLCMLTWGLSLFVEALDVQAGTLVILVSAICATWVAFRLLGFSFSQSILGEIRN